MRGIGRRGGTIGPLSALAGARTLVQTGWVYGQVASGHDIVGLIRSGGGLPSGRL